MCPSKSSIWPLKRDNKLTTINIPTGNYTLSFDITVQGILQPWSNIIHVSNGTDGSRAPGIWLFPNDTRLHIRIGDTTNTNWGMDTDALDIGKKTHVSIVAKDSDVKVTIDKREYNATQPQRRPTGSGYAVYMSSPWYHPSNAIIENLSFVVDGVTIQNPK
jgi:hypothetical protein